MKTIPGGKGDFIVKRDGEVLWDKRSQDNQFPEDQQVLSQL